VKNEVVVTPTCKPTFSGRLAYMDCTKLGKAAARASWCFPIDGELSITNRRSTY